MMSDSNSVVRTVARIASRAGIVVGAVAFHFAVIGVFGLPWAIVSTAVGITFSIVIVMRTNGHAEKDAS